MSNEVTTNSALDTLKAEAKTAKHDAAIAKRDADKTAKALAVAEKGLTKAKDALAAAEEAAKGAASKEAKKIAADDVKIKKAALAEQEKATKAARKDAESAANHAAVLAEDAEKTAKALASYEAEALAKAKKEADAKLPQIANEINVRMEKAEKLDGQADDHRLAAAIQTAEAEKLLKASGGDFEAWFKDNIKSSKTGNTLTDRTRRLLLLVGRSENPAQKLADIREGNKQAVAKHREKAAEAKQVEAKQAEASGDKTNTAGPEDDDADYNRAVAAFEKLTAKERMTFLEWAANLVGAKINFDL